MAPSDVAPLGGNISPFKNTLTSLFMPETKRQYAANTALAVSTLAVCDGILTAAKVFGIDTGEHAPLVALIPPLAISVPGTFSMLLDAKFAEDDADNFFIACGVIGAYTAGAVALGSHNDDIIDKVAASFSKKSAPKEAQYKANLQTQIKLLEQPDGSIAMSVPAHHL